MKHGTRQLGAYRLIRKLGEGGFGRTYLAEHNVLGCPAVIKQARYGGSLSREIVLAEARLLYRLQHWGLPTVKDLLEGESGELYIVMSYVEGDELMSRVCEHGPVELETVCWIAQRVLATLHYLHYSGVVHRDVKPANIIVDWDAHNAVLVDFGLAKDCPAPGPEVPGYTEVFGAPEQVTGKPAIPESDIYGLGMTLIYALGGDPRVKKLPFGTPAPFQDFVHSMVRQDPLHRPRSCDELNLRLSRLRRELFGRAHSRQ